MHHMQDNHLIWYQDMHRIQQTYGMHLPEDVVHYVLVAMSRQLGNVSFNDMCVGEAYLDVLDGAYHGHDTLRQLAEYCLFMAGFFPQKTYDMGGGSMDFLLCVGRHAYAQLALVSMRHAPGASQCYNMLGHQYVNVLDVLWMLKFPNHRYQDWPEPMRQEFHALGSHYMTHLFQARQA